MSEISKGRKCTKCGAKLSPGQAFCTTCGTPVDSIEQPSQHCPVCDTPRANGARFCSVCGYNYASQSDPQPKDTQPEPATPTLDLWLDDALKPDATTIMPSVDKPDPVSPTSNDWDSPSYHAQDSDSWWDSDLQQDTPEPDIDQPDFDSPWESDFQGDALEPAFDQPDSDSPRYDDFQRDAAGPAFDLQDNDSTQVRRNDNKPVPQKSRIKTVLIICGIVCALCAIGFVAYKLIHNKKEDPDNSTQSTISISSVTSGQNEYTPSDSGEISTSGPSTPTSPAPIFSAASASSMLPPDKNTSYYGPYNAIDNDRNTAWTEGVNGFGAGEWLRISAESPQTVYGINVVAGYTKSQEIYSGNNRPRLVTVTLSDGYTQDFELVDSFGLAQTIAFPESHQTTYVQLTIKSAYAGSSWDDTCITEVKAY